MSTATVRFEGCLQDSQEHSSDDEHMVSIVYFAIEAEGRVYPGVSAQLKQTVGDDFETGSIEVSTPPGYTGPMNYHQFSNIVAQYYRTLVGGKGKAINIQGAKDVRMRNNRLNAPGVGYFDYQD